MRLLLLALGTACLVPACSSSSTATPLDEGSLDSGPASGGDRDGGTTSDSAPTPPVDDAAHDAGTTSPEDGGSIGTAAVECGYAYSGYNDDPSVKQTSTSKWICSATLRSLTANGIPDHATGTFPNTNCPNAITEQTVSASMTLTPENTGTPTSLGIGGVGYAFNGVKLDPGTAGTCTVDAAVTSCSLIGDTGAWNIEALGQSSFNFGVDDSNAHVQPTGTYHYHGMPNGILTKLGKGMAPTLVGFALDGFPVYARYGYATPTDATSAVKVMKGSYQLKSSPSAGRPSTATYPLGAFTQDYEYVAGSGDLDACNGRTDVTPEFPQGIYHYYITDTYPFIQRCSMGTPMEPAQPDGGGMMMGPGGGMMGPPPDGGMPGMP